MSSSAPPNPPRAIACRAPHDHDHAPPVLPGTERLRIHLGRHVLDLERTPAGGTLTLTHADGTQPLAIEITAAGPVLRLGTGLSVALAGTLAVEADAVSLVARRGDVSLRANDDVVLGGERVRLNC